MDAKKYFLLLFFALQAHCIFSKNAIIILYGCSSVGKTSISNELQKTLSGNWKYIPSNKFQKSSDHSQNYYLWQEVNRSVANGYNVMVDTHHISFLNDTTKDTDIFVVMLHCSPEKLIEHIDKRNTNQDQQTHRNLKTVLNEFCRKYKSVKKQDDHVDQLKKDVLKNNYGFFTTLALKKIIKNYFSKDQQIAYIAPHLNTYDCFVDTGKLSISACAKKIKDMFLLKTSNSRF